MAEENFEDSPIDSIRLPSPPPHMKKLLIFDLNKVLICKNKHRRTSFFLRPNVLNFVTEMMEIYEIAVWTSGKKETMDKAMTQIFGNKMNILLFYWTQNDCTILKTKKSSRSQHQQQEEIVSEMVPQERGKAKKKQESISNIFKKDLGRVWERFPQYNRHNTILLDDSLDKLELNPPHTSVTPKKFDVYEICEKQEAQRIAAAIEDSSEEKTNQERKVGSRSHSSSPAAGKRGMKRGREVSKYQRYGDMDTELQRDGLLWKYLSALAAYPGNSDEFISTHHYRPGDESESC